MGTIDHRPSSAGSRGTSALRWWADTYAVCIACFVAATWTLFDGQPVALTLALYGVVVVCGTYARRARLEFRKGWRRGYESAIRTMLEHQAGKTPDVEVRAAVHGDPIPEPWDEHVSPLRPRSRA